MNTVSDILRKALTYLEKGTDIVVVTVLESDGNTPADAGKKMIVPRQGPAVGTIGGGSLEREAEKVGRTMTAADKNMVRGYDLSALGMTCGGKVTLLFEYFSGSSFFVIFGGGHVGTALAPILESIGYTVAVFDNREGVIDTHSRAGRTARLCSYEDISRAKPYLTSGKCFIASHNHEYDTIVLRQLLEYTEFEYAYIGMIGSSNKVRSAFRALKSEGLSVPSCVYAPVGLEIGGGTPAEIAVSIASEIIALTYGKSVPHMRR